MQIILTQDELELAAKNFVLGQLNVAENQEISVDFTAGRGANGVTATIDITTKMIEAPAPKKVTRSAKESSPFAEPTTSDGKASKSTSLFADGKSSEAEEATEEAVAEQEVEETPVENQAEDAASEIANDVIPDRDEEPSEEKPGSIFKFG